MDLSQDILALAEEAEPTGAAKKESDDGEKEEDTAIARPITIDAGALKQPVIVMCGSTDWANAVKGSAGRMTQGSVAPPQFNAPTVIQAPALKSARIARLGVGPCAGHCVAITDDGRVFAWGLNTHGQLGLGEVGAPVPTGKKGVTSPSVTPATVAGPTEAPRWTTQRASSAKGGGSSASRGGGAPRAVSCAVGKNHTLITFADGAVWAAGHGARGALGYGTRKPDMPDACSVPRRVAVGGTTGQPPIRAVAAGADFSLAVGARGELYSWGWSEHGKLGHGTDGQYNTKDSSIKLTYTASGTPRRVDAFAEDAADGASTRLITNVVAVSAGKHHAACVSSDGHGYTWGDGAYGKLGHRTQDQRTRPTRLAGARFTTILCGDNSTCALGFPEYRGRPFAKPPSVGGTDSDGCLYVWGVLKGTHGEGATHPVPEQELAGWALKASCLSMGASHVAMVAETAAIAWAQSAVAFGQLGYGTHGPKSSHRPQKLVDLDGVAGCAQVAAHAGATFYVLDADDPVVKELAKYDVPAEVEASPESNTAAAAAEAAAATSSSKKKSAAKKRGSPEDTKEASKKPAAKRGRPAKGSK